MATYNIVSVRRTPNQLTAPTYTELGPLYVSTFSIKDYKTLVPADAQFTVNLESLDEDTKEALRDLVAIPLEVWAYRDGVRIFAGPVVGGAIKGNQITLVCRGRLIYLAYMLVETDKDWTAEDMFTIGAELVDDWQDQDYGNFGLLTASIGTLGTTRDFSVAGATEFPRVLDALENLAKGSFDVWQDATTGALEFAAARGTDLSGTVSIERGIAETEAGFAIGPGLVASEVYAAGTSAGQTAPLTTSKANATLRASFGRAGVGLTHDPVVDTDHLSDLAQSDLDERGAFYFSPGGDLFEVLEATYGNLEPGNTVEYSYDAGLGKQTLTVRIEKRQLSVGLDGTDKIQVEFE
jgi:hypothetical protein